MNTGPTIRRRIKAILEKSSLPMDVENVRVSAGLKNWESTKAILLEMVLRAEICGQKTTKSWVFWAKQDAPSLGHRRENELEGMGMLELPLSRVDAFRWKRNGRR